MMTALLLQCGLVMQKSLLNCQTKCLKKIASLYDSATQSFQKEKQEFLYNRVHIIVFSKLIDGFQLLREQEKH